MNFLFGDDSFPNNTHIQQLIFEIFLVLQGSLMGNNIVFKCGNDSLMFNNIVFKCGNDSLMFHNLFLTRILYLSKPHKKSRVEVFNGILFFG